MKEKDSRFDFMVLRGGASERGPYGKDFIGQNFETMRARPDSLLGRMYLRRGRGGASERRTSTRDGMRGFSSLSSRERGSKVTIAILKALRKSLRYRLHKTKCRMGGGLNGRSYPNLNSSREEGEESGVGKGRGLGGRINRETKHFPSELLGRRNEVRCTRHIRSLIYNSQVLESRN